MVFELGEENVIESTMKVLRSRANKDNENERANQWEVYETLQTSGIIP